MASSVKTVEQNGLEHELDGRGLFARRKRFDEWGSVEGIERAQHIYDEITTSVITTRSSHRNSFLWWAEAVPLPALVRVVVNRTSILARTQSSKLRMGANPNSERVPPEPNCQDKTWNGGPKQECMRADLPPKL
ncbi:unnamed protein product [Dovyalis caffra]|uniref:Uncharacterized protein n=1 Tax=Dovyalis caffra TaxID=77055 RepID=A0AAV1RGM5_9ROSI|nr:unnamed protein product [Dovyalis caffra]